MKKTLLRFVLFLLLLGCAAYGQNISSVLCALQERKIAIGLAKVNADTSYAILNGDPVPSPVISMISWGAVIPDFPTEADIPDLQTALKLLNLASGYFDDLKANYIAYDPNTQTFANQGAYTFRELEPPFINASDDQKHWAGISHFRIPPIYLPSIGTFTEENWRYKLKLLASNIKQLKVLPWSAVIRDGGHGSGGGGPAPAIDSLLCTVIDHAKGTYGGNYPNDPYLLGGWKSEPFHWPTPFGGEPYRNGGNSTSGLNDRASFGLGKLMPAMAGKFFTATLTPYAWTFGAGYRGTDDFTKTGGAGHEPERGFCFYSFIGAGAVDIRCTKPTGNSLPERAKLDGLVDCFQCYSLSAWGDISEAVVSQARAQQDEAADPAETDFTCLRRSPFASGTQSEIHVGNFGLLPTGVEGNAGPPPLYYYTVKQVVDAASGLWDLLTPQATSSWGGVAFPQDFPGASIINAWPGTVYNLSIGSSAPTPAHSRDYGYVDGWLYQYAYSRYHSAQEAFVICTPNFTPLPDYVESEQIVSYSVGEVDSSISLDPYRISTGRGLHDVNQLGFLSGRPDGFGTMEFRGSPTEFELLYEYDRNAFEPPIGTSVSFDADAFFDNNEAARAGWKDRFDYLVQWHLPRLRQVKGKDVLIDITYNSGYEKTLKFYWASANFSKTGNFYHVGGTPFKEIKVRNPSAGGNLPNTERKLTIVESGERYTDIEVQSDGGKITTTLHGATLTDQLERVTDIGRVGDQMVFSTTLKQSGIAITEVKEYPFGFGPLDIEVPILKKQTISAGAGGLYRGTTYDYQIDPDPIDIYSPNYHYRLTTIQNAGSDEWGDKDLRMEFSARGVPSLVRTKIGAKENKVELALSKNKSTSKSSLVDGTGTAQYLRMQTVYSNGLTKAVTSVGGADEDTQNGSPEQPGAEVETRLFCAGDAAGAGLPWSLSEIKYPGGYHEQFIHTDSSLDTKSGWGGAFTAGTKSTTLFNDFGGVSSYNLYTSEDIPLDSATVNDATKWGAPKEVEYLRGEKASYEYEETGLHWGTTTRYTSPLDTGVAVSAFDWMGRPTTGGDFYGQNSNFFRADFSAPLVEEWTGSYTMRAEFSALGDLLHGKTTKGVGAEIDLPADGSGKLTIEGRSKPMAVHPTGILTSTGVGLGSRGASFDFGATTFQGQPCLFTTTVLHNKQGDAELSGQKVKTYYDWCGRVVGCERPSPVGGGATVTETWTYEDAQRKVTYNPGLGAGQNHVVQEVISSLSADGSTLSITVGGAPLYKVTRSAGSGSITQTITGEDDSGTATIHDAMLSTTEINPAAGTVSFTPFGLSARTTTISETVPNETGTFTRAVKSNLSGEEMDTTFTGGLVQSIAGTNGGVRVGLTFIPQVDQIASIDGTIGGQQVGATFKSNGHLESVTGPRGTHTYAFAEPQDPTAGATGGYQVSVTEPGSTTSKHVADRAGDLELGDSSLQIPVIHSSTVDLSDGFLETLNAKLVVTTNAGGVVAKKAYDGNVLVENYSYNSDGSLASRTIAGSVESHEDTFVVQPHHQVDTYHDGSIITTDYAKIGPRKEVTQTASTGTITDHRRFNYQHLTLTDEIHELGPWQGVTVHLNPDAKGRLGEIVVTGVGGNRTFTLGYDNVSRFTGTTSTANGHSFSASVTRRTALGEVEMLERSGTEINGIVTTRSFDQGKKYFTGVSHATGAGPINFSYPNRDAQWRIKGRSSNFGRGWADVSYGSHGQIQSVDAAGSRFFSYNHDARGNRTGEGLVAALAPGPIDQISSRILGANQPRTFGATGSVDPGAEIRILPLGPNDPFLPNSGLAIAPEADGKFTFSKTLDDANAFVDGQPYDFTVRARKLIDGKWAEKDRPVRVLIPPVFESLQHNFRGERSQDRNWDYKWDGAGRLLQLVARDGRVVAPGVSGMTIDFVYDADGRRTEKTVTSTTSLGMRIERSRVLYAGWLPILERRWRQEAGHHGLAEINRRWFQWGPDRSGTLDGAGGIGGLMAIHEEDTGGQLVRTLLPVDDGLGNIVAVVDGADGSLVASFEHGPFGEPISETGESDVCPFRWQTKWYDPELKGYYFGYRYYDPHNGRWLSRDPMGEAGGFNRYAYCGNDPINRWDYLGLDSAPFKPYSFTEVPHESSFDRVLFFPARFIRAVQLNHWLNEQEDALGHAEQGFEFSASLAREGYINLHRSDGLKSGSIGKLTPNDYAKARADYRQMRAAHLREGRKRGTIIEELGPWLGEGGVLNGDLDGSGRIDSYEEVNIFGRRYLPPLWPDDGMHDTTVDLMAIYDAPAMIGGLVQMAGRGLRFAGRASANAFRTVLSGREMGGLRLLGQKGAIYLNSPLAVFKDSSNSIAASSPLLSETITASGGRLGGTTTRALNSNLAEQLIGEGFTIIGGGARAPEEFIRGSDGLGNTFVDITATNGSSVIRIQTVSTLADGVTLTAFEEAAAARIRRAFPNDILILIPKP